MPKDNQNRKQLAVTIKNLIESGWKQTEIAESMGYRHKSSITHLKSDFPELFS